MKILRCTLIALLLCSTTAIAEPASESSIEQLLIVTEADKKLDGLQAQLALVMDAVIKECLQGRDPSPRQQQAITNMIERQSEIIQEALVWEKLEPIYVRLYKQRFTEEEVTALLEFYETPAGKALIRRSPELMQQAMREGQMIVAGVSPQLKEVQKQFRAEMAAASE